MRALLPTLALLLSLGCLPQEREAEAPAGTATAPQATDARFEESGASQAQDADATIHVGGEFSPASISVPQGKPIRLAFHRTNDPSCGDEVHFPDLGIRQKIPANATTIVELPPQQEARTLQFTCGMNMMKGQVVVQ